MTDHVAGVGSPCGFGVTSSHLSGGRPKKKKKKERKNQKGIDWSVVSMAI
jgi:hypothetical protein